MEENTQEDVIDYALTELECLRIKSAQQEYQLVQYQAEQAIRQTSSTLQELLKKTMIEHGIPEDMVNTYALDIEARQINVKE